MRLARDFGTVSELYPPGITDLRELPHRWFDAIRHAMLFLSFDDLDEDERPPKHLWLDEPKLKEWMDAVRKRRKDQAKGEDSDIEDPVQNKAAESLVIG